MNKKFKGFFNWNLRNNGGFTLVELIVVIAILAILAGVAVPAYSGYVTKANKQADISLVGEVKDALMLYYYNNYGSEVNGYVVLTPEGVVCTFDNADQEAISVGKAAMDMVFGAGWENNLSLKHNWKKGSLENTVVDEVDSETLAQSVNALTGMAGSAASANDSGVIFSVLSQFAELTPEQRQELESYQNEKEFPTIATNLMVKYLAEEMGGATIKADPNDGFTYWEDDNGNPVSQGAELAFTYAMVFTMANSNHPNSAVAQEMLDTYNDALKDITEREARGEDVRVREEMFAAFDAIFETPVGDNGMIFDDLYYDYACTNAKAEMEGMVAALDAMNMVSGNFSDAESLKNKNLFGSSLVVNALDDMKHLKDGNVVIRIQNGKCVSSIDGVASN